MKPRLLDLFCGAGGCSVGYERAGFEVVGVDIKPQPNYPFEFIKADALDVLSEIAGRAEFFQTGAIDSMPRSLRFDAIHASPPCQAYTKAQRLQGNEHPELIEPVRQLLRATGLPYIIENVPGAPLEDPILLCGTMFGLPLYRHRLFECSFAVTEPLHGQHYLKQQKLGRRRGTDEIHQPVGHFSGVAEVREVMDMPAATQNELAQAVPPAYTEHIGQYLMAHLQAQKGLAA